MQLEDEQVARICVENEAMVEALNGVYTRQQATLRALSESSLKSVEGMTKHVSSSRRCDRLVTCRAPDPHSLASTFLDAACHGHAPHWLRTWRFPHQLLALLSFKAPLTTAS